MKVLGGRSIRITCANTQSTPDIFKFCDLLYSAKAIYCLSTGTGTLAAALQKPVTVLYGEGLQKAYRHSGLHSYINVGTDFTQLDRAKKWLTKQLGYIIPLGKK
jgi:ADP-heptose:LPS heptosyltransferase